MGKHLLFFHSPEMLIVIFSRISLIRVVFWTILICKWQEKYSLSCNKKENKKWVLVDMSQLPDYPLKKVSDSWHRKTSGRQFVVVQSLSHVRLFATPWTSARQASLSLTISWSLFKLMSIESVILSNDLIICRPLLLMPSVFPSIRVFGTRCKSFLIDVKRANLTNYINLALYKIASCKAENNLSSLCRRLNGK